VCADIILYIIYEYTYIYVYERVESTKNLSSLRRKKHATVTHPVKGLHKIYTYYYVYMCAARLPGGEKKRTHDTHDPQEYVNINYLKGMLRDLNRMCFEN